MPYQLAPLKGCPRSQQGVHPMAGSRRGRHPKPSDPPKRPSDQAGAATVASLGVQARLVRVDADREREIASLIARYEAVRVEWERLIQQAVDLLGKDFRTKHDRGNADFPPRN